MSKYNGQEWQSELGLNYTSMDFRNYDNAIGRFINPDRLTELAPMHNPYRFAFNNPVYFRDPTGLFEDGGNQITWHIDKKGRVKGDTPEERKLLRAGRKAGMTEDQLVELMELSGYDFIMSKGPVVTNDSDNNITTYVWFANDALQEYGQYMWNNKQNRGGSFRIFKNTSTHWTGKSWAPKYYADNRFGSGKTSKHPVYNVSKVIKKGTIVTTVLLGTIDVGTGVYNDYQDYENTGYTNGKNTVVSSTEVLVGAGVGYAAGAGATWLTAALAGAAGGSVAPGVGTVIGFIVGGVVGYYASEHAGELVQKVYESE